MVKFHIYDSKLLAGRGEQEIHLNNSIRYLLGIYNMQDTLAKRRGCNY